MNKLKTLSLVIFGFVAIANTSCTKDNSSPEPAKAATLTVNTVTDLDGSKGDVYYRLSDNKQATADDVTAGKWDLKFSTTSIYVNSGSSGSGNVQAQVVDNTFDGLTTAPTSGYKTDATGAKAVNGWYLYTATNSVPNHAILPVAGKIIVIKTSTGNYAKLEMKSYYKGNPDVTTAAFADFTARESVTPSRFYTFKFAYQADGSAKLN
ncbi:hypothetical protein FPZ42_10925 [Mucilaginibacter achroorhodeus]|uniref:Heme-binding HmuY-like protein n=1 Tax=Mucilaginibacter achroorhodeus TaxID=2599294 RepID=A0A563U492_9SPHI|nr:HmuY family protein [Mucilaginibacter achroorhodeus]TWR26133.1 hypothetical protein FPZ42_10925 [Mucilaginibacter achroorhodeus]